MSIELKVGEWYQSRSGFRVRVIADVGDTPARSRAGGIFVAVWENGGLSTFHPDGACTADKFSPDDIVKHLPGCTGWDWKEPKWRPATLDDLRNGPVSCRVRNHELKEWSTDPLLLIGVVQYPPSVHVRHHTEWATYRMDEPSLSTSWWGYCEVEDK